jgi:TonB family protein
MLKISKQLILIGCIFLIFSSQLFASAEQEKQMPCHSNKNKLDHAVNKAIVISKVTPKYPVSAARNKQEGWVRVSYVIKEDGSVELPIIEDSSGIESFEKAAIKALKSWTFDPATRAGKTIEQCQNSVQLNFQMKKVTKGASRRFVKGYRQIIKLINENKLIETKKALEQLSNKPRKNFYEDKFFFSLKAKYYQALGDKRQELSNLRKLIPQGKNYLPKESYNYSLVRAFQLALLNNELSSSLYFYNQLKETAPEHQSVTKLLPYIDEINNLINSSENIYVAAQINKRDHWSHYLARNSFTFTNIDGELNTVDLRCDNYFSTYPVKLEKQWNIPRSWGECKVFVHGKQGAKFDLVEVSIQKS